MYPKREIARLIRNAERLRDIRYVRAEAAREGDRFEVIGANSRRPPPELAALVSRLRVDKRIATPRDAFKGEGSSEGARARLSDPARVRPPAPVPTCTAPDAIAVVSPDHAVVTESRDLPTLAFWKIGSCNLDYRFANEDSADRAKTPVCRLL